MGKEGFRKLRSGYALPPFAKCFHMRHHDYTQSFFIAKWHNNKRGKQEECPHFLRCYHETPENVILGQPLDM